MDSSISTSRLRKRVNKDLDDSNRVRKCVKEKVSVGEGAELTELAMLPTHPNDIEAATKQSPEVVVDMDGNNDFVINNENDLICISDNDEAENSVGNNNNSDSVEEIDMTFTSNVDKIVNETDVNDSVRVEDDVVMEVLDAHANKSKGSEQVKESPDLKAGKYTIVSVHIELFRSSKYSFTKLSQIGCQVS
jgi:hypothetical protein